MTTNTTENLNELLEIEGDLIETNNKKISKQINDKEVSNDFTYTRENLYDIIEKGSQALDELMEVARSTQHPRAYEVLQETIKTLVSANEKLLEMQKTKKQIDETKSQESQESVQIGQAFFVGGHGDLQKALADARKKDGPEKV